MDPRTEKKRKVEANMSEAVEIARVDPIANLDVVAESLREARDEIARARSIVSIVTGAQKQEARAAIGRTVGLGDLGEIKAITTVNRWVPRLRAGI